MRAVVSVFMAYLLRIDDAAGDAASGREVWHAGPVHVNRIGAMAPAHLPFCNAAAHHIRVNAAPYDRADPEQGTVS